MNFKTFSLVSSIFALPSFVSAAAIDLAAVETAITEQIPGVTGVGTSVTTLLVVGVLFFIVWSFLRRV